jgi:hypothetical protein
MNARRDHIVDNLKKRGPRETPTATWDELVAFRNKALKLGYKSVATAALAAWEWLQREEHLLGAFLVSHYRPKDRPNAVRVVHPKTCEEAWWPLFDETQRQPQRHPLFPELMAELDAIKTTDVVGIDGLIFRRDHAHRRGKVPLHWITPRGDLDHFRSVVKDIIRTAGLRDELSFCYFNRAVDAATRSCSQRPSTRMRFSGILLAERTGFPAPTER